MARRNPETLLVNKIQKLCADLRADGVPVKCIKLHGNGYQESGTPDLHITLAGRSVWLEVKVGSNCASPLQLHRLQEWSGAGAVTAVVWSVDDALAALQQAAETAGLKLARPSVRCSRDKGRTHDSRRKTRPARG